MRGKLVGPVGVVTLVMLVTGLTCCGGVMGQSQAALQIHDAHWIWMSGAECVTGKPVYLRKTFNVASMPLGAALQVACDDHYKIWINGQLLGETRSPGPMAWRVSDVYDILHLLCQGDNYVFVEASNTQDKGAFLARIRIVDDHQAVHIINSDSSWEASFDPGDDKQRWDAGAGDWHQCVDYGRAATTPYWFYPRPPVNLISDIAEARVPLQRATISPRSIALDRASDAEVSQTQPDGRVQPGATVRGSKPGQSATLICDFGRETVGYLVFTGYAHGPARITISCGEYLDECNSPFQAANTREFAKGHIRWVLGVRRAFRYAAFEVETADAVRVDALQVQAVGYPTVERGSFRCSDETLNNIWDVSLYTLQLCMQDFYEDGIKRDTLMWLGDLRVEALVNYYVFGDAALARRCLMQMADIQMPDGMIIAVGPDASSTYLPDYCAYFVISVMDYYRFTGDLETTRTLYPYVRAAMAWFDSNCDAAGMFERADRPGWWIFVDWDESLDLKDRVTPMQALYYWALHDASDLARAVGQPRDISDYTARAKRLRASANWLLFDRQRGAYIDCISADGPSTKIHKQPNALALLAGLPAPDMVGNIVDAVADPARTPPVSTPYMNYYVASALFEHGKHEAALHLVSAYWGAMIDRGATTFWEKFDPSWPDPYEEPQLSYCHGWSAGPGQLLPAYIAGIRPLKPGFDEVLIAPELGGLKWVKATVPTPHGDVSVDLRASDGRPVGRIMIPDGCRARVEFPCLPSGLSYALNGRSMSTTLCGGKTSFKLTGGKSYDLTIK